MIQKFRFTQIRLLIALMLEFSMLFIPLDTLYAEGSGREGTLINSGGTIYVISQGGRWGFRNPEELAANGFTFSMAVPATNEDMQLPFKDVMGAPNGTLVLDTRDGNSFYLMANGSAHAFKDPQDVALLGFFDVPAVRINLSDYPKGDPIGLEFGYQRRPNGYLVNGQGTVYLMTPNGKSPFPDPSVFFSWGFDFSSVLPANDADMQTPDAAPMKYRDGTLVSNYDGTIFLMSGGMRYGFRTWSGFVGRGYNISSVIAGSVIGYPQGVSFD